jgi:hypothetical protein
MLCVSAGCGCAVSVCSGVCCGMACAECCNVPNVNKQTNNVFLATADATLGDGERCTSDECACSAAEHECWQGMCGMCPGIFGNPRHPRSMTEKDVRHTYTVTPSHVDCFVDVARGMRACAASLAAFLSARSCASLVARTPMAQDMMTVKAIPMTTIITRGCVVMVTTTAVRIESHNSTPSPRRALRYAAMRTLVARLSHDLLPLLQPNQINHDCCGLECGMPMQSRSFSSKFVSTEHTPTAPHAHRGPQQVLKADPLARMAKDRGAHQPSADEVRRLCVGGSEEMAPPTHLFCVRAR